MSDTQSPENATATAEDRQETCDLARLKREAEAEHPLSKGDIVDVLNNTLGGKEIVEGRATIVSPAPQAHRYRVRFHGDGHRMTYERFVLPEQKVKAAEGRAS